MTPIFKRLFKQEGITALFCILFCLIHMVGSARSVNRDIDTVYNLIMVNHITPESFDTLTNADMDEMFLYHYKYGFFISSNQYNVAVPDVKQGVINIVSKSVEWTSVMGFILAGICSVTAFSDERRKKGSSFVNALPYRRNRLFLEKMLCGLIWTAVFYLVGYVMLGLWLKSIDIKVEFISSQLCYKEHYMDDIGFTAFAGNKLISSVQAAMLFYSIMLFAQTLFGRSDYSALLAIGAVVGGLLMIEGMHNFYRGYGLSVSKDVLFVFVRMFSKIEDSITTQRVLMAAFTAVFLAASYFADSRARLERIGSLFMFKPLKHMVCALFAVEGAFAFHTFIWGFCGIRPESVYTGILLLFAGAAITLMLLKNLILKEAD